MDGTGDHQVTQSKPGSERQSSHISSHMWKLNLKDKYIHKYIRDHMFRYILPIFINVGTVQGVGGGGRGKENDSE
jgi:hypothetical protein